MQPRLLFDTLSPMTTYSNYPQSFNPEHHHDLPGSFYNRRDAIVAARILIWGTASVREITKGDQGYFPGCPTFTAKVGARTRQFRLDNYGRPIDDASQWLEVTV